MGRFRVVLEVVPHNMPLNRGILYPSVGGCLGALKISKQASKKQALGMARVTKVTKVTWFFANI